MSDFAKVLVFLGFCHSPKKITKEKIIIINKDCVVGVNV
jgi:hypothetical protein